ncbi:MAG: PIN domain-containing protein [Luteitalea sp.]|nr:PIN domain-containing protein [Luteitalea sp.]
MKYLLDTQCWLWMCATPERLSRRVRSLLRSDEHDFYLSVASAWEIAIKYQLGRLSLPAAPREYVPSRIQQTAVLPLGITLSHVLRVGELPLHHRDPFDRLLVAQAFEEDMTLVSADRPLSAYNVRLIRA